MSSTHTVRSALLAKVNLYRSPEAEDQLNNVMNKVNEIGKTAA